MDDSDLDNDSSSEEKQKNSILQEIEKHLTQKNQRLKNENKSLSERVKNITHDFAESEQKKTILADLVDKLEKNIPGTNDSKTVPANESAITEKELKQQKEILIGIEQAGNKKNTKRYYVLASIGIAVIVAISVPNMILYDQISSQYEIIADEPMRSHYTIQNLKGDTVETWISWQIPPEKILYVNIVKNKHLTDERFEAIKSVMMSEESFEIPDWRLNKGPKGSSNVYYVGWLGALEDASQSQTKFPIPLNFEIISDPSPNVGDIVIKLTDLVSGDGYSGYTRNIIDGSQNQILKSDVTIYDIDGISNSNLEVIARHELGHVFGLAHTTASEDLMAPKITTHYPYVSPCVIDAISQLYDGSKKSEIVCGI